MVFNSIFLAVPQFSYASLRGRTYAQSYTLTLGRDEELLLKIPSNT